MFHLSLPVSAFAACLEFYRDCFGARIVMLDPGTANVFAFDGQLTLHDRPDSGLGPDQRREMHFGYVASSNEWSNIRDRIVALGHPILKCIPPEEAPSGRGKLLLLDPGGNLVEINSA